MAAKTKYQEFRDIIEANFERSLLLTILLSVIVFMTFQQVPEKEIEFKTVEKITTFEIPPEIKQMEKIKAPPRPSIPIETDSEDVPDDVTIAETVIDTIWKPPPEIEEPVFFVAYDDAPILLKAVKPDYPVMAQKAQIEGDVQLILYISDKGDVVRVDVVSAPMAGVFDQSAIRAAKQFKFKPAYQRDKPVPVKISYIMKFTLR